MNGFIQKVTDLLGPAGSSALGQALIGLAILVIGLIVVKFITGIFKRLLKRADFLYRESDDGTAIDLVTPVVSLIKGILTIFVLMAVLQHFGLTDVLAPLKDMVNTFLGAVPNIIGAGVVGYAGWIIAKIVSQLVGVGLSKVDEQIAEKTKSVDIKVSKFGSAFIFAVILIPIAVAALGVLNIPAISGPASDMINELMAAVPNIVGAGVILLVTYFAVKFVNFILSNLLDGMNVNALPEKLSMSGRIFNESFTPVKLVTGAVMFFSMLTATTAAVNTLGVDVISNIFAKVLEFGGGILIGGIILIIGNFFGTLAYDKLSAGGNQGIANIARFAILGLVIAMGLRAMGLADNIVNLAFGLTLGGIVVALALAFGFGGRDAAKTVADSWVAKINKK